MGQTLVSGQELLWPLAAAASVPWKLLSRDAVLAQALTMASKRSRAAGASFPMLSETLWKPCVRTEAHQRRLRSVYVGLVPGMT